MIIPSKFSYGISTGNVYKALGFCQCGRAAPWGLQASAKERYQTR